MKKSKISYKNNLKIAIAIATAFSIPSISFANGMLENPLPNEIQSGVGIVSGWHCTANEVEIFIDGESIGGTGVGSVRNDTTTICGHNRSGFGLLYNYNILEDGDHLIQSYADGILLDERQFTTIRSGGVPFLQGKSATTTVQDFPNPGDITTLSWSQAKQSFVVTGKNNNSNQNNSDGYKGVSLSNPSLRCSTGSTLKNVVVSFTLANNSGLPVSEISFEVAFYVNNLAVPLIEKSTFNYKIPGGIANGKTINLNLEPNMFSKFTSSTLPYCDNTNRSLKSEIVGFTDGQGVNH